MLVRAYNQRAGQRRRALNEREYNLLHFLVTETEPNDPFSPTPSKQIPLTELVNSQYVRGTYRKVTPRTFRRELMRLRDSGFIKFTFDEQLKDFIVELDFDAIGKY
jgi:hypothetical protein